MNAWLPFRSEYLDELLRLEGLGDSAGSPSCCNCDAGECLFRCEDCFGGPLFCETCIVSRHALLPLHRVKVCVGYLLYAAGNLTTLSAMGRHPFQGNIPAGRRSTSTPWTQREFTMPVSWPPREEVCRLRHHRVSRSRPDVLRVPRRERQTDSHADATAARRLVPFVNKQTLHRVYPTRSGSFSAT